jgi:hypothetical protein
VRELQLALAAAAGAPANAQVRARGAPAAQAAPRAAAQWCPVRSASMLRQLLRAGGAL